MVGVTKHVLFQNVARKLTHLKVNMSPMYKYKIKFAVTDNRSHTYVLLWDEECQRLIGKTAQELLIESDEVGGVHNAPREIMDFVGRCYLFKVVVVSRSDAGVTTSTVNSLCDEPNFLALHEPRDGSISDEDNDSDDDLSLMVVDPIGAGPDASLYVDDEVVTPSSKRCYVEDEEESDAPITQGSTNKKLKGVKIEEA